MDHNAISVIAQQFCDCSGSGAVCRELITEEACLDLCLQPPLISQPILLYQKITHSNNSFNLNKETISCQEGTSKIHNWLQT